MAWRSAFATMSAATRVQPSISKATEKIVPVSEIDAASRRAAELPATPSAVPARPASEDAGQRSRAIIPGDDPGDQQPPKSTPLPSSFT
jgi:hypothetical protein